MTLDTINIMQERKLAQSYARKYRLRQVRFGLCLALVVCLVDRSVSAQDADGLPAGGLSETPEDFGLLLAQSEASLEAENAVIEQRIAELEAELVALEQELVEAELSLPGFIVDQILAEEFPEGFADLATLEQAIADLEDVAEEEVAAEESSGEVAQEAENSGLQAEPTLEAEPETDLAEVEQSEISEEAVEDTVAEETDLAALTPASAAQEEQTAVEAETSGVAAEAGSSGDGDGAAAAQAAPTSGTPDQGSGVDIDRAATGGATVETGVEGIDGVGDQPSSQTPGLRARALRALALRERVRAYREAIQDLSQQRQDNRIQTQLIGARQQLAQAAGLSLNPALNPAGLAQFNSPVVRAAAIDARRAQRASGNEGDFANQDFAAQDFTNQDFASQFAGALGVAASRVANRFSNRPLEDVQAPATDATSGLASDLTENFTSGPTPGLLAMARQSPSTGTTDQTAQSQTLEEQALAQSGLQSGAARRQAAGQALQTVSQVLRDAAQPAGGNTSQSNSGSGGGAAAASGGLAGLSSRVQSALSEASSRFGSARNGGGIGSRSGSNQSASNQSANLGGGLSSGRSAVGGSRSSGPSRSSGASSGSGRSSGGGTSSGGGSRGGGGGRGGGRGGRGR